MKTPRTVVENQFLDDLQRCSLMAHRSLFPLEARMSDHYHDPSDLRLLKQMQSLAPEDFKAWLDLNNIVDRG